MLDEFVVARDWDASGIPVLQSPLVGPARTPSCSIPATSDLVARSKSA